MSLIDQIDYVKGTEAATPSEEGDYVLDKTVTKSGQETYNLGPKKTGAYCHLLVQSTGNEILNDGTDTETVKVSVVDGLEVARGADPVNATVLDYNGDVTVSINGVITTKKLSNGTVSFDLTTDKPATSTITITAESLADHPAESDTVEIEVVSA